MIYIRKVVEVDAIEFTEEVGKGIIDGAHSPIAPITYEEGRGFRCRGATLKFGDYVIAPGTVMDAKEFHAQLEPLLPPVQPSDPPPAKPKAGKAK